MDFFIKLLLENKPLLLFLVVALGYFLGRISIRGFSFGVAAVLFVGLGFGALHKDMALPDMVYIIGLILFVYTIGLKSASSFFASFKRSGLRDNLFIICLLLVGATISFSLSKLFNVSSNLATGLFCGAFTNTPALAAVVDVLKHRTEGMDEEMIRTTLSEPVIGYSLSYPIGVIGVILLFQWGMKLWKINMTDEQKAMADLTGISNETPNHINIEITATDVIGKTIADVIKEKELTGIIFSRYKKYNDKNMAMPTDNMVLQKGDILTTVGSQDVLNNALHALGKVSAIDLAIDRSVLDMRRIFVSNRDAVGKTIEELALREKYQAVISRVRRGDIDLPAHAHTRLESGDRVRVIAPREQIQAVSKFLGDSYTHLSEVDYISISIGISLGLLLGMIPLPLPGGGTFKLGFAAGPLIVALILGKVSRTGNIVWIMSHNANLTLRQIGAVFFLAGIGLKSGYAFYSTFAQTGPKLILLGAVTTLITMSLTLIIGKKIFKIPYNVLMGMMSGMQTQPACLAFANEKDGTDAPNVGYATVFPTAMVVKIMLAQILLSLLA